MKKTNNYVPTLLTKLLQSQCILILKHNNSLYKEKVYKRNPSYKIYENLDQVNSKLTAVEGGFISEIRLINDENFVHINGKT